MTPREPRIGTPHKLGFGHSGADTVCFLDEGGVLKPAPPGKLFAAPKSEGNRTFLSQILY